MHASYHDDANKPLPPGHTGWPWSGIHFVKQTIVLPRHKCYIIEIVVDRVMHKDNIYIKYL